MRENAQEADGTDGAGISGGTGGADGESVFKAGEAIAMGCAAESGG